MKWRFAVVLALGACVPAGTDEDPAGGVDVTFLPSAETSGTPFTTPDGYTVTIHQFAMRLSAADIATEAKTGLNIGGGFGPISILAPSPQCHLRVTAVPEGAIDSVGLTFAQSAFGDTTQTVLPPCGLNATTTKRFTQPAEDYDIDLNAPQLPTLVIDADLDNGASHLHILAAVIAQIEPDLADNAVVTIKANTGIPVRFPVNAELFFLPDPSRLGVTIPELFLADANGDGTLTGTEMAGANRACDATASTTDDDDDDADADADAGADAGAGDDDTQVDEPFCTTVLYDVLNTNLAHVFGKGSTF